MEQNDSHVFKILYDVSLVLRSLFRNIMDS